MKSQIRNYSLFVLLVVLFSGCYPGGAEYTSDTDLVYTNYNDQFNFGSVQTYFMSDSIYHVVDEGKEPSYKFDNFILSELERNFDALGYTRLDSTNANGPEPDVVVVVTVVETTNYYAYSYPWYPGWGWGYYWKDSNYWGYPGYGWGYPWYGGTYVTSYSVGTILWDMFDPDNVDEDNEVVNVEWTGALNGLLGTSASTTENRISRGIKQAFDQSPYLQGK
ncbi:MAG: DUF4136 domain-containing protein [Bacteroidetes bacterium]|nr:DUF4136 domain-containing protein [Bacteroidota bacterium]